jgi:tRNA threonylcarbamoyladenosine biosynthesis protein TsaE
MELSFTLSSIHAAAQQFMDHLKNKKIVAFHGQMGAGKTTFIHALCDALQVSSSVSSPTFSIINQYNYSGGTLYHLDLYRLKDAEEAIQAGVEDCLYSGNLCLVEWPERAPGLFPEDTVWVSIDATDEQTRCIRIAEN